MKLVAILGIAGAACMLVAEYYRRKAQGIDELPQATVLAKDLSAIQVALEASGSAIGFAAILFESPDWNEESGEAMPNVQLSFEEGQVFVDWVLLAEPNVRARERIEGFLSSKNLTYKSDRQNGIDYLRISTPDPSGLCRVIIEEFRPLAPDDELGLVYQGFAWDAA